METTKEEIKFKERERFAKEIDFIYSHTNTQRTHQCQICPWWRSCAILALGAIFAPKTGTLSRASWWHLPPPPPPGKNASLGAGPGSQEERTCAQCLFVFGVERSILAALVEYEEWEGGILLSALRVHTQKG